VVEVLSKLDKPEIDKDPPEIALVTVKELKVPTLVKEEPVTLAPRVVESKILALLMRKALPVAKLTLPVVKVKPPAKEEVVLLPEIVVVVVPPT
jgi:hypothetical protein